jgi:protein phosphatase
MAMHGGNMNIGSGTHVGMARELNEDSFLIDEARKIFIIADGMGGHQAGEIASSLAVKIVHQYLSTNMTDSSDLMALLRNAITDANRKVLDESKSNINLRGMGTTVVVAISTDTTAVIANVGDSRLYALHNSELRQITEDHNVVRQMLKRGLLTEEQAKYHRLRNVLSKALGSDYVLEPDIFQIEVTAGDSLLLCSDGLTAMVDDETIREVLIEFGEDPQRACDVLIEKANDNGGNDNITTIVISVP